MKLVNILTGISPILKILLIIVLTVAGHFIVKAIRRFSQWLLTIRVDGPLINFHGQRILIPNRNIAVISQFRGGCIRADVDIQLPRRLTKKRYPRRSRPLPGGCITSTNPLFWPLRRSPGSRKQRTVSGAICA